MIAILGIWNKLSPKMRNINQEMKGDSIDEGENEERGLGDDGRKE